MSITHAIIIVTVIGVLTGILLTLASKFLGVKVNEKVIKVREVLPGANCGACGFAGCDDYAAKVASDITIKTNLCTPGGSAVAMEISQILGVDFEAAEGRHAILKCGGSRERTNYVMEYQGYQSCAANKLFYRGRGACDKGCLGFGDCVAVCQYNAIKVENGLAHINKNMCIGCGQCVKACPNGLIEVVPNNARIVVTCSATEGPKATKENCSNGCVSCKICEKTCKFDAIHVIDSHAVIDYEKCKNCGMCVNVCPRKTIKKYSATVTKK